MFVQENVPMPAMPYIRNLRPINHKTAEGKEKEILDFAHASLGFIPNMYANMANAPALLGTYLNGYKSFRTESGLMPSEQEVVFLAISQFNGCDYCTAAHSMIADKVSGVPREVLNAIRERQPIPDQRLAALYAVTVEMVRTHGHPGQEALRDFFSAGYQERELLYLMLAIAVKTLSNFSNIAFATEVDERFAAYKVS